MKEEIGEYGDDALADILDKIKRDPKVKGVRFSHRFLNNVAEGFERHGFEEVKLFLMDKKNRKGHYYQAGAVMAVIKIFERYPMIKKNRKVGRLILKSLDSILQEGKKE
jgi:hypothetical protein